jgi:ATP-dependent RNA helicase DDX35
MAFWRPGEAAPPSASSLSVLGLGGDDVDDAPLPFAPNPFTHSPLAAQRRALPIYEHRLSILHAVEKHGVVIVVAETGSGKSTRE